MQKSEVYKLSKKAHKFICDFDSGKPVAPSAFVVNLYDPLKP